MDDRIEFEFIDWQLYFGVFQDRLTRQPQSKYLQRCPIVLFMRAFELEFRDKALKDALLHYKDAAKLLEPFACYRLAEIYLKHNKFNQPVDFQLSWFYLVKSTVLACLYYTKDLFSGKDKLSRYVERLDSSHVNCLNLIDKFEDKQHALLLKHCFRLVMGGTGPLQTLQYCNLFLKELGAAIHREPVPSLLGLAISFVTARLQIQHKPMDQLLDIFLANGSALADFAEEQLALLGCLVTCPKDNILLSKLRDTSLELLYLCKIFKFAIVDRDLHFSRIADTVFNLFGRLYDNIDKVTVLQDRIFIAYYLAGMLHKLQKKQQSWAVLESLEEFMKIRPQSKTEGFYLELKGKIQESRECFEMAAQAFRKEDSPEDNHHMIVSLFLGRIQSRLGNAPLAEEHLLNAFHAYNHNYRRWSELTLQTTYYYRKICRMLKRLGKYPKLELPKSLAGFPAVRAASGVLADGQIEAGKQLKEYDRAAVKAVKLIAKTPFSTFYHAIVDEEGYALVQQLPALSQRSRNLLIADLQSKHSVSEGFLHPIVGMSQEEHYHEGLSYYAVQILYPPCTVFQPSHFDDRIRQLKVAAKAFSRVSKLTDPASLLKVYNASGRPVLAGWAALSPQQQQNDKPVSILGIPFVAELVAKSNLEFLSRKLMELEQEPLCQYLEDLFQRI